MPKTFKIKLVANCLQNNSIKIYNFDKLMNRNLKLKSHNDKKFA